MSPQFSIFDWLIFESVNPAKAIIHHHRHNGASASLHYPPHSGNKTTIHALPPHPPIALTLARVLVARWPVSWPGTRLSEPSGPRSMENAMGEFSPIVAIVDQCNGHHHPHPYTPRSYTAMSDGFYRYRWV